MVTISKREKDRKHRLRIQSARSRAVRGLDAYFTPYDCVFALHDLEPNMPQNIWEPFAGAGNIMRPLIQRGHDVIGSDLADYGAAKELEIQVGIDYFLASPPDDFNAIVSNPPYAQAFKVVQKSIQECDYVAYMLRTNFLESESRMKFFQKNPPARVWISSARLPMMHRYGYEGEKSSNNQCFAWFVWDRGAEQTGKLGWFNWKEHQDTVDFGY